MICNNAGCMVNNKWLSLPERYSKIKVGCFQIMPNHFHGIFIINDVGAGLVPAPSRATTRVAPNVGEIAGSFKSITTPEYIRGANIKGWIPFNGRLWQHNYFEHIHRDQTDHERIAKYIDSNPLNWEDDEENMEIPREPKGVK
jgi:putative transposase